MPKKIIECPTCGDDHPAPKCREFLVETRTVGYRPVLRRFDEVCTRDEKEAREAVKGWRPEDFSYEGWRMTVGTKKEKAEVFLDEIRAKLPWPERWRVVGATDVTMTPRRWRS